MTEQEKTYMHDTVGNGSANINNPIWIKAFANSYPTLSMGINWHYAKVLSKIFIND